MASAKKVPKTASRPLPPSLAPDKSVSPSVSNTMASESKVTKSNSAKGKHRAVEKKSVATSDTESESEQGDPEEDDSPISKGKGGKTAIDGYQAAPGGKIYTGGKQPLADGDATEDVEDSEDGDYNESTTAEKQPLTDGVRPRKKQSYVVTDKTPQANGRVVGRKLVMWHRPRMVEKLMMHLQYECHRNHIKLPWDKVVERLSPGSSGASALQHLNKLRDILIAEGHMVSPLMGKKSVPQDKSIRGYIRDETSDRPTDVKVVRWGDYVDDRKQNLEVEGVVRGSGNYRRGTYKAIDKMQQASGERRNRVPLELRDSPFGGSDNVAAAKRKSAPVNRKRSTRAQSSLRDSPDPALLDSDGEYDPSVKKKPKIVRSLRSVSKPGKYKMEESEDEVEEKAETVNDESHFPAVATPTPRNKQLLGHEENEGFMTPPASRKKVMVFKLSPTALRKVGTETGTSEKSTDEEPFYDDDSGLDHDLEQFGDDGNDDFGNQGYEEAFRRAESIGGYETPTRMSRQASAYPVAQEIQGFSRTTSSGAPKFDMPVSASVLQSHGLPALGYQAGSTTDAFSMSNMRSGTCHGIMMVSDQALEDMYSTGGGPSHMAGFLGTDHSSVDPFYDGLDPQHNYDLNSSLGWEYDGLPATHSSNDFGGPSFDHFAFNPITRSSTDTVNSFTSGKHDGTIESSEPPPLVSFDDYNDDSTKAEQGDYLFI